MKLEEARKLATPGPLHVEAWQNYVIKSDSGDVAVCTKQPLRCMAADAALLAHAHNMLPELVEALEGAVFMLRGAGRPGQAMDLERVLAKAKEVPGV